MEFITYIDVVYKTQSTNSKEYTPPSVHCSIIYSRQATEAAQVSISNECIKQLWDIYTVEHYSAVKKEGTLTFCDSMDGPGEHYAK